ncbi:DUF6228 family protein [Allokutzneria sp. NRRL B-24872]|uniref:DUF6228 family protein n=1 Tax=Allokutzneria sp. NRRL B-24872 TaxID=1137961 RepID=UPI0011783BBB|nr:DUF6228 family protein [Allokutzneria sp. NRRL B-24872]
MAGVCEHGWQRREIEMRCMDDTEVRVGLLRFAERHLAEDANDGRLFFLVEIGAPGLHARLEGATNLVDGMGLPCFLGGLDFRGWEGEKHWRSADRDIEVVARFSDRGRIGLEWTLRPWRQSVTGEWTATVITELEAGAEKDTLVADLHNFLAVEMG